MDDERSKIKNTQLKKKPNPEGILFFGKYKSRPISEVYEFDPRYCKWLFSQEWLQQFTEIYTFLQTQFTQKTLLETGMLEKPVTPKKTKKSSEAADGKED
jgi:hypothetical protein